MSKIFARTALFATVSLIGLSAPAQAADAPTADAPTRAGGTSSAGTKGQANDVDALSTADIIVTGTQAAANAPISSSLTTTQPQAVVTRELIENALPVASDFNMLVSLTPGVTLSGTSNGVGLSESKVQIRGFQDGEYNVTYDSIPFADTNNPTHHSTSFFPSNTIETAIVNRGPGNASQLGQATYGGNVNLYSRAVQDKAGFRFDGSYGSFNTKIARFEVQSGELAALGGGKFAITGQYLDSNGALTFSPTVSKNVFAKWVQPIGSNNTLTVMSTYNRNFYYQSDTGNGTCGSANVRTNFTAAATATSATTPIATIVSLGVDGQPLTQLTGENCAASSTIGIYGKDYGLVGIADLTPIPQVGTFGTGFLTSGATRPIAASAQVNLNYAQNAQQYNRTDKTTDFSYLRLQSDFGGGFSMDNRLYMYGYTNNTFSGQDASGRTANTVILTSGGAATAGIPIYYKQNKYRVIGYIGQANYDFSLGRIKIGGWIERADTDRALINFDGVTGAPNFREGVVTNADGTIQPRNIRYLQKSSWDQYQLFSEFEFRPTETLEITPGVKYVHFKRGITATVNQTSRSQINTSATWTQTLPFLTANWAITPNWSTYLQYARGFYVPDLSSFYTVSNTAAEQAAQALGLAALAPQTTTNYQFGTVWHGEHITLDADIYKITVNNKIAADPAAGTAGGPPAGTLINIGRVEYQGVEGQVSYSAYNFTVYVNGTLQDAINKSLNAATGLQVNAQIARASKSTAALGAFYNKDGLFASVVTKYQGPSYGAEYNLLPGTRLYRLPGFATTDLAVNYTWGSNKQFRLGLQVSNLTDNRAITQIGTSSVQAPTTGVTSATGATVQVQSGYGPFDQIQFLPPRAVTVSFRVGL